ncbi:RidA family protein [Parafrankia sp. EUN1f]|uniref:RidA family protein n=1 Tax=Parafrankia sp. EUN1f TaxID=102897 RepID=UPI0001C45E89|nr:RidA family protein [Parafrankia sp. EUN1f]EFC82721.1 Endoribonuclease L-PSP [Parafrankia sp. EUN1f]
MHGRRAGSGPHAVSQAACQSRAGRRHTRTSGRHVRTGSGRGQHDPHGEATVGLGLEHVCKTTYYVTDVTLRDDANVHFIAAFAEPRPARTFVEVAALPYGCAVEVGAVATKQAQRTSTRPI